jgi:hypothetical protein
MKKHKFFRRFQGGWPIHDLAKKILQNAVASWKSDQAAEAKAEENDSEGWDEDNQSHTAHKSKPMNRRMMNHTLSRSTR